ncbi:hypothetical protein ACFFKU_14250 [Kineococcus gynurae]|uniref:Type II secretion system (T2SS) protein F n=1 Tax=Kineococcus gynurae TaxID=452979 RepID=A0ABV5LTX3_9ACTN
MSTVALAAAVAVLLGSAVLLLGTERDGDRGSAHRGDGGRGSGGRGVGPLRVRRRGGRGVPVETPADVPLLLDLVATGLGAGLPVTTAVAEAVRAVRQVAAPAGDGTGTAGLGTGGLLELERAGARVALGADPSTWRDAGPRWAALAEVLELSATTGLAPADLLRAEAARARRSRRRAAEEGAGRAGALLVVPLGLCSLPAFLLLAVVPVVLDLAVGTWEGLR